jgi:hypothetical protein
MEGLGEDQGPGEGQHHEHHHRPQLHITPHHTLRPQTFRPRCHQIVPRLGLTTAAAAAASLETQEDVRDRESMWEICWLSSCEGTVR